MRLPRVASLAACLLVLACEGPPAAPGAPLAPERLGMTTEEKVESLFQTGFAIEERSPREAERYFRRVVELSPGSTYAQRARNRLERLQAKRAPRR